ncbi:hypothetical protein [Caballeronia mineralivorans]|nr:hypothetical protein [Caballeronia mineralivorans]
MPSLPGKNPHGARVLPQRFVVGHVTGGPAAGLECTSKKKELR